MVRKYLRIILMNATVAESIISQLTISFCVVSFIWDIIILHRLTAVPDWFLEPYILWSKFWTVNFNLPKALFNLNSESKKCIDDFNNMIVKKYIISRMSFKKRISRFSIIYREHLLIDPAPWHNVDLTDICECTNYF